MIERFYLCEQLWLGKIKCECFNEIEEIKKIKKNDEYISYGPLEDKNMVNILPVHKSVMTVIKIPKYIPYCFDNLFLMWKLNKIHRIIIK